MVCRNLGHFIFSIIIILVLTLALAPDIPPSISTSSSPYDSGYDHGCDDADISDPDDRYINQPEKGPSFHTNEFMRGYNDGYDACSDGNSDGGSQTDDGDNEGSSQGGKTIEDYCVEILGKSNEECNRMVDGNDIKVPGLVYLLCNAIRIGGISSSGGLSALLDC